MTTDKVKILVTGANGQVGNELRVLAPSYTNFDFIFSYRADFDLENESDIISFLNDIQPHFIINCAAYTAVDKAETQRELANKINNLAVGTISKWTCDNNCKLIHISTDYVFDGTSETPLIETDITSPINYYGESKLLGEISCVKNNPEGIIIRTSWVYSKFGNNFVKTMLRLMSEKEFLNIVNDQVGSPTYAADLAKAILDIVSFHQWQSGIYNYSNEGQISWFDFAAAIKKIANLNCELNGIASKDFPTPAKRPKYSLLNKSKIKNAFKVDVPNYYTSLETCLSKILS